MCHLPGLVFSFHLLLKIWILHILHILCIFSLFYFGGTSVPSLLCLISVYALVPIRSLVPQILCVFFRILLVIEAVCFHFLSSYPVSLIAFTCCLLFSPVIAFSSFLCVIPNQLSELTFSNVFHVHVTGFYLDGTFYILIANSKCCRLQATFTHSVIYIPTVYLLYLTCDYFHSYHTYLLIFIQHLDEKL